MSINTVRTVKSQKAIIKFSAFRAMDFHLQTNENEMKITLYDLLCAAGLSLLQKKIKRPNLSEDQCDFEVDEFGNYMVTPNIDDFGVRPPSEFVVLLPGLTSTDGCYKDRLVLEIKPDTEIDFQEWYLDFPEDDEKGYLPILNQRHLAETGDINCLRVKFGNINLTSQGSMYHISMTIEINGKDFCPKYWVRVPSAAYPSKSGFMVDILTDYLDSCAITLKYHTDASKMESIKEPKKVLVK